MERIEVYEREDGLFDWRLVAANGEVVTGSLQGFTERNDARESAERAVKMMLDVEIGDA